MKALISTSILLSLMVIAATAGVCPDHDSVVLFANPEDCSTYYQCYNGQPILLPCPRGLQWNDAAKLCEYGYQSDCEMMLLASSRGSDSSAWIPESITRRCGESPTGTRLADPEDCAGFYVCVDTRPVTQNCIGGLLYNDNLQVCDWPENVDCCENGGETPEATVVPPGMSTENPGEVPGPSCETGSDFLPNHKDCTSYYQCVNGKPLLKKCPDHLHWNQDLSICDHPHSTSCDA